MSWTSPIFFVNEDLTPTRSRILYALCQMKRNYRYKVKASIIYLNVYVFVKSSSSRTRMQRILEDSLTQYNLCHYARHMFMYSFSNVSSHDEVLSYEQFTEIYRQTRDTSARSGCIKVVLLLHVWIVIRFEHEVILSLCSKDYWQIRNMFTSGVHMCGTLYDYILGSLGVWLRLKFWLRSIWLMSTNYFPLSFLFI